MGQMGKFWSVVLFINIGNSLLTRGRGGGGVSESMDGQGCAILALEVVPKKLIFV